MVFAMTMTREQWEAKHEAAQKNKAEYVNLTMREYNRQYWKKNGEKINKQKREQRKERAAKNHDNLLRHIGCQK